MRATIGSMQRYFFVIGLIMSVGVVRNWDAIGLPLIAALWLLDLGRALFAFYLAARFEPELVRRPRLIYGSVLVGGGISVLLGLAAVGFAYAAGAPRLLLTAAIHVLLPGLFAWHLLDSAKRLAAERYAPPGVSAAFD